MKPCHELGAWPVIGKAVMAGEILALIGPAALRELESETSDPQGRGSQVRKEVGVLLRHSTQGRGVIYSELPGANNECSFLKGRHCSGLR